MIYNVGYKTFTSPTFKANIDIENTNSSRKDVIDDMKPLQQLGDHNDYFRYSEISDSKGFLASQIEYYRKNPQKRFCYRLYCKSNLNVKNLTKAIMAKEPITTQDSKKIRKNVQYPYISCFEKNLANIEYCKQTSVIENNFYYKNGKKAVCIQYIDRHRGVAEYYDKNGNLQVKKYKKGPLILTEKYNDDGQISYRIISDNFLTYSPIVIKDNIIFQLNGFRIPSSSRNYSDNGYRVLVENNKDKSLTYCIDECCARGIHPSDSPEIRFYKIPSACDMNDIAKKINQRYLENLMKINPLYTAEHLEELYFFPQKFIENEYAEDATIFKTNYGINLSGSLLHPTTASEYNNYTGRGIDSLGLYDYDSLEIFVPKSPVYDEKFVLDMNKMPWIVYKTWDRVISNFKKQYMDI